MKSIRLATINDLPEMLKIFVRAREFMKNNGNPTQWGDNWPSEEILREDIKLGRSYAVVNENDEILATYAFLTGIDPTYLKIWDGNWISNDPYVTIHRLASSGKEKDIFSFIISEIVKQKINIRVDTHKDNKFMINQLLKNGFKYCGIISPIEGGERNAYELIIK